jgi:YggT family protein
MTNYSAPGAPPPLDRITAPIYAPIRRIMPDLGALDLSPMVVLIGILIIRRAILPPLFLM